MYQTCIFCSSNLGTNEVIETFPVGKRVAFDASKGRLWAICPKCTRWNLAPIEERWEAVEQAEKSFRDTRLRVQSENIGMAKMRDATFLVRVGSALPGELAAWRYGRQLMDRNRRNNYMVLGAAATGLAMLGGIPLLATVGVPGLLLSPFVNLVTSAYVRHEKKKVVMEVAPHQSPTGHLLRVRAADLTSMKFERHESEFAVSIFRPTRPAVAWRDLARTTPQPGSRIVLTGQPARFIAARAMVGVNKSGAKSPQVKAALRLIDRVGSPEALIAGVTRISARPHRVDSGNMDGRVIVTPDSFIHYMRGTLRNNDKALPGSTLYLDRTLNLAVEMALHEESERRAMLGELDDLEDAWREAEEIARIADALPDDLEA